MCDSARTLRPCSLGALLWIGALLASAAAADRVWLHNGNHLEGTAVVLASGEVEIRSALGTLTLPAAAVAGIERGESIEQEIERRLASLAAIDADTLYDLALLAEERGASTLANRLLAEVIVLDPEHEAARRRLGYRRFAERWVSEAEYRELRGEILFRGEWMAPESRAQILALEAIRAEAAADQQRERTREARLRYEIGRLQQAPPTTGIPYYPYGYGGASVVVPLVVPAQRPSPGAPPATAPAPSRAPVAPLPPRHNRGRFALPR